MDAGVHTERRAGSYGEQKGGITTYESNTVPEDGITRAGGFR